MIQWSGNNINHRSLVWRILRYRWILDHDYDQPLTIKNCRVGPKMLGRLGFWKQCFFCLGHWMSHFRNLDTWEPMTPPMLENGIWYRATNAVCLAQNSKITGSEWGQWCTIWTVGDQELILVLLHTATPLTVNVSNCGSRFEIVQSSKTETSQEPCLLYMQNAVCNICSKMSWSAVTKGAGKSSRARADMDMFTACRILCRTLSTVVCVEWLAR